MKFKTHYLWYVSAVIFYASAVWGGQFDPVNFCLGSAMLCIGYAEGKMKKKKEAK